MAAASGFNRSDYKTENSRCSLPNTWSTTVPISSGEFWMKQR
jgi:hypothetical protein